MGGKGGERERIQGEKKRGEEWGGEREGEGKEGARGRRGSMRERGKRESKRESFIRSVTRGRWPSPLTDSHGVGLFASGQRARTQGAGRTALARALSTIV